MTISGGTQQSLVTLPHTALLLLPHILWGSPLTAHNQKLENKHMC